MPAKKAAAKKRPSSRKKVAKSVSKSTARRSGSSTRRTPKPSSKKPSSKKTRKSVKSMSQKKVSKKDVSTAKVAAKKTADRAEVKPVVAKAQVSVAHAAARPSPAPATSTPSPAPRRRSPGSVLSGPVRGFTPYQPKRGEEYMSKEQLEHFRQILLAWKRELMEEVDRTMLHMKDEAANFPDPADRATQEEEFSLELRTRDRERKLIKKIDATLDLIDNDDYGYCEACGVEIGIKRLEARPTATLCIDCKTLDEIKERQEHG